MERTGGTPASSVLTLAASPYFHHDTSPATIAKARDDFVAILGPDNVTTAEAVRRARSGSPWSPAAATELPDLVVSPLTTAHVSHILATCNAARIPVHAFAGGTGLGGSSVAVSRGVCLDFARMSAVLSLHRDDMDVVAQPGLGWQELNEMLADEGLFFPPDPAPGAKIGGMVYYLPFLISLHVFASSFDDVLVLTY